MRTGDPFKDFEIDIKEVNDPVEVELITKARLMINTYISQGKD